MLLWYFRPAHRNHAQVKQALNQHKGGRTWLVKSYEQLHQKMQDILTQGLAPPGIIQDSEYQNKDMPKWLCDAPTKQGIHAMLQLERSEEELERLNHKCIAMYSWHSTQQEQLQLAGCIAQGK